MNDTTGFLEAIVERIQCFHLLSNASQNFEYICFMKMSLKFFSLPILSFFHVAQSLLTLGNFYNLKPSELKNIPYYFSDFLVQNFIKVLRYCWFACIWGYIFPFSNNLIQDSCNWHGKNAQKTFLKISMNGLQFCATVLPQNLLEFFFLFLLLLSYFLLSYGIFLTTNALITLLQIKLIWFIDFSL